MLQTPSRRVPDRKSDPLIGIKPALLRDPLIAGESETRGDVREAGHGRTGRVTEK